MSRSDIFAFLGDEINCGPNTVTKLAAQAGQSALQLKILTAGASGQLRLGGATGSIGAWSGVGITFGIGGYVVSANEIAVSNMSGDAYLWVTGNTMTISILGGNSTQP